MMVQTNRRPNRGFAIRIVQRALGVILAAALGLAWTGPSISTAAGPQNLELAISYRNGIFSDGKIAAFGVSEGAQGQDLNGDGDTWDHILHVYDAGADVMTPTRHFLTQAVYRPICRDGDNLAFITYENQNHDFNGDGDKDDHALAIYRISSGAVDVHDRAASSGVACGGGHVAFAADEAGDNTDYNGDGDTADSVWHVYDIAADDDTNLEVARLAAIHVSAKMNDDALAFTVSEEHDGRDLNSDGDQDDIVFMHHDLGTGITTEYELAGYLPIDRRDHRTRSARFVPVQLVESDQGPAGTDHNGDGDTSDSTMAAIDMRTGNLTRTGYAGFISNSGRRWLTLVVNEADQGGTDMNGDGDIADDTLVFYHALNHNEVHARRAVIGQPDTPPRPTSRFGTGFDRRWVAAEISESHSRIDLDGDGQMVSHVVEVWDPLQGTSVNTEMWSKCQYSQDELLVVNSEVALTCRREGDAPVTDINRDGDTNDTVPGAAAMDGSFSGWTGVAMDLTDSMLLQKSIGFFLASEFGEGRDLNQDGDQFDRVLHSFDVQRTRAINHGYAVTTLNGVGWHRIVWAKNDEGLLFAAGESSNGQDYNGDGDTWDAVIHILR